MEPEYHGATRGAEDQLVRHEIEIASQRGGRGGGETPRPRETESGVPCTDLSVGLEHEKLGDLQTEDPLRPARQSIGGGPPSSLLGWCTNRKAEGGSAE